MQIDTILNSAGINAYGTIQLNENTYNFNIANPKNNWLYGAFLAFKKLERTGFIPKSFATIGTSSGLDSIGAYEVFHCEKIYQTDLHPNVINLSQTNVSNYIPNSTTVETFLGNLCEPLFERKIKADLLYVNIPNIPSGSSVFDGKKSASLFEENTEETPKEFKEWLLALQYTLLVQAKEVLNPNGIILIAIGNRVPYEVLEKLFTDTGYSHSELVNEFKMQTEPDEIITGYANQESKTNIHFDFYDYEKSFQVWTNKCEGKNLSAKEIKKILSPFLIRATEALNNFHNKGKPVGHIYTVFELKVK